MHKVYMVELILHEIGGTDVIATKRMAMHMNQLPAFEYGLAEKGVEIIRDAQCHDNQIDRAGLWRRSKRTA